MPWLSAVVAGPGFPAVSALLGPELTRPRGGHWVGIAYSLSYLTEEDEVTPVAEPLEVQVREATAHWLRTCTSHSAMSRSTTRPVNDSFGLEGVLGHPSGRGGHGTAMAYTVGGWLTVPLCWSACLSVCWSA